VRGKVNNQLGDAVVKLGGRAGGRRTVAWTAVKMAAVFLAELFLWGNIFLLFRVKIKNYWR